MAKRIRVSHEGVSEQEVPDGVSAFPAEIQKRRAEVLGSIGTNGVSDAELTAAKRRQRRLREGKLTEDEKPYELVELDGETVYIKRLRVSECVRCLLMEGRSSSGELDVTDSDDELRSYMIPVLWTCVFEDAAGDKSYFSFEDAVEIVDSTKVEDIEFARMLFNVALFYNPGLVPKKVTGRVIPAMPLPNVTPVTNEPEPASTRTISTTSMPSNGENGSQDTTTTAAPVTLPTD